MSHLKIALRLELLTYSLKGSRTHKEVWGVNFPFPLLFNDRDKNEKKKSLSIKWMLNFRQRIKTFQHYELFKVAADNPIRYQNS